MPRVKRLKDSRLVAFRLSAELHDQVDRKAKANGRTLSKEIRLALVKHVQEAA